MELGESRPPFYFDVHGDWVRLEGHGEKKGVEPPGGRGNREGGGLRLQAP
jgi:hypothetical protein